MIKPRRAVRVGITMGDPSGIGPAIVLKSLQKLKNSADFMIIGDSWVLNQFSSAGYRLPGAKLIDLKNVSQRNFEPGKIKAEYGRASMEYLDKALELIGRKEIDCLVTAPISKQSIHLAGFEYSGHTEYFSDRCGCNDPVMMLLNDKLKFSLVTRHVPLERVPKELNRQNIYSVITTTLKYLKKFFLIAKPRIVVCGLNPHASDGGVIGKQEERLINPVVQNLNLKFKAHIFGPLSSDVAIYRAYRGDYDAVIAMYHDQALIPLKLLGQEKGVNLTLGLSFIRTSPLHGTAFDIAKDPRLSDPSSMIEATKLAIKCFTGQRRD